MKFIKGIGTEGVHLIILFTSSIILFASFLVSIVGTTNIQQSKCRTHPRLVFSSNSSSLKETISREIANAKDKVTVAISDCNDEIEELIPSLVNATKNGANVTVIIPYSSKMKDMFDKYGLKNIINVNGIEKPIFLQTFIVDDKAFMAPFISYDGSEEHKMAQMIAIDDCSPLTDEIETFVNIFIEKHNNVTEPNIYTSNYIAKSSAMLPVKSENSSFFFINNPGINYPLKEDTINFLTNTIINNGEYVDELLVYTYSAQLPVETNTEINQFSLYTMFKALFLHNTTKVRYLISEQSLKESQNLKYIESFATFSKAEFRYYDEQYEGVNFIINGDDSYIFNHVIQTSEIENYQSLHFVTDDRATNNYCRDYFEKVWNLSKPFVIEWQ